MTAVRAWFFRPVPLARVAVFRTLVYLFLPLDMLVISDAGAFHGAAASLYKPLLIGRLLGHPMPSEALVEVVKWSVIALALLAAATGRLPRLLGAAVCLLYLEWLVITFSFGKVDHDRFAFLVALAVLPTVGRSRADDGTLSERAGWAFRATQIAVVATYFLSAWAKIRFGGLEWVNSATLVRAVLRRGTAFSKPLLDVPWVLHLSQWGIMTMELASPALLFVRPRWQVRGVLLLLAFHVVTFASLTIMFWPHVLCLVGAFLPLERLAGPLRLRPLARLRQPPETSFSGG
ncbi:MAG: MFS transporter permease [Actinomycetota bacterium]